MQIIVSLTIEVSAGADVNQVAPLIIDAGRCAMREALRLAALHAHAQVDHSPACQPPTLHADGTARRVVLASFGRVAIPVLRKRCAACAHRFRASTAFFAPLHGANATAQQAQVAERLLRPTPSDVCVERDATLAAPLAPRTPPPAQLLVELGG